MNEPTPVPAVAAAPAPAPLVSGPGPGAAAAAELRRIRPLALGALLLSALALGLALLFFSQTGAWEQRLDRARADEQAREQRSAELERRIGALERQWAQAQGDADVAGAQVTDADLRRRRDALAFIDVERVVEQAQLQLRLGAAPAAVIDALAAADARLGRLGGAPAQRVQTALRHDVSRLKAAPDIDRGALAARLDLLLADVDSWHASADPAFPSARPIAGPEPHPGDGAARVGEAPGGQGWGARVRNWLEREFGDLLRIRRVDTPEALLLDPAQQRLLRDRVRLGVLDLRQAILARDERTIRSEEAALVTLLTHYFDPEQPGVAAALTLLRTTATAALPNTAPSLEESLAALRAVRGETDGEAHAAP
jgi:uncharacterized protein HemX